MILNDVSIEKISMNRYISADLVSFDIANKTVILNDELTIAVILNLIPKSYMERKTKKNVYL